MIANPAITDVQPDSHDGRVIVLAPLGRDASVITHTLGAAWISCITAATITDLIERVREGAGAALVTEEALTPSGASGLIATLAEQPSWSDLPIVLLLASDGERTPQVGALALASNITVLHRPIPAVTLVSALQVSLRARRRQYEVRDLLALERAAREHAESATRSKDEFLATISHELRTPLSAILIWSHLLDAGRLSGDQARDGIHAIVTSAEAQSLLIEDLLDVSRMLMGKLRLDVQSRSLGPLVQAAAAVVRPMADAKQVRLEMELDPHDDTVSVDPDRVQQIFWNLLSNAVKFTQPGGTVSLRTIREPEHVMVKVIDTGEGISPEFLPHMFERFRQADPATRRHAGLGLGLPIVQQLVELHGGSIHAHSAGHGHGATFTVRLPLAPG